jgi:hypothetical protein
LSIISITVLKDNWMLRSLAVKLCAHFKESSQVVCASGAQQIHGGSWTPALKMKQYISVHFPKPHKGELALFLNIWKL